jgi:hypothetical protein
VIDITLKAPMGSAAAGQVAANRKKFRGTLERAESGWQIVWRDEPAVKPGQKVSKPSGRRHRCRCIGFYAGRAEGSAAGFDCGFQGTMNREMLMLVEAISREKNVERDVVFGAVEAALAQATKKLYGARWTSAWRWTATAATTRPSAAGWWCPTRPACRTPTPKSC